MELPGGPHHEGLAATTLDSARLRLDPLRPEDAVEMAAVLADPELYEFTGGEPVGPAQLEVRYRMQIAGSGSDDEEWLNWIVRLADTGEAIGYVQATVTPTTTDVAWVIGLAWQGQGYASEAAGAMCEWLRATGVTRLTAHVAPAHGRSNGVAAAIGLRPTDEVDADGERVWASA